MATLKASDILADLTDDSEKPTSAKPRRTPGASPSLEERKVNAAAAAQGKPSPYASDLRAKLRQKTQLNFGGIPLFIRDEFERLAKANRMGLREYLYHLLREQGASIPPYQELDGRKL